MGLVTGRLARILFALPFGVFGAFHWMGASKMVGMVPNWVPGPAVMWIYATGAVLVMGCLCFITGKFTLWAGIALGSMLLVFALTIHLPTVMSAGGMEKQVAMLNMLKDIALAGAAYSMGGEAAL